MTDNKLRLMETIYGVNDNNDGIWDTHNLGEYADAIISDGWIRLPCEVGQMVYYNDKNYQPPKTLDCLVSGFEIDDKRIAVLNVLICGHFLKRIGVPFNDFGKTVFLSREEAEKALKERERK